MWPVTSVRQNSPAVALLDVIRPKPIVAATVMAGTPSRKNKLIFSLSELLD
jgi:hypothetical protein